MLKLSLESINSRSPYTIQLTADGSFSFVTDEALTYEVGFIEDYMIAVENAYQFFLIPKEGAQGSRDENFGMVHGIEMMYIIFQALRSNSFHSTYSLVVQLRESREDGQFLVGKHQVSRNAVALCQLTSHALVAVVA